MPRLTSSMVDRLPFKLVSGCAAVLLQVCAGTVVAAQDAVSTEPVTLINDGGIQGCGVRVQRIEGAAPQRGEILLMRRGGGTEFVLRIGMGALASENGVTARLTTASYDTVDLFPQARPVESGIMETRAALDSTTGALLMQELLVSGGTFSIGGAGTSESLSLSTPTPAPHSVRQAYLMCAGDLFRPDEDNAP